MDEGVATEYDATDRRVLVKLGMMMDGLLKATPRLGQGAILFFVYAARMQALRANCALRSTCLRLE